MSIASTLILYPVGMVKISQDRESSFLNTLFFHFLKQFCCFITPALCTVLSKMGNNIFWGYSNCCLSTRLRRLTSQRKNSILSGARPLLLLLQLLLFAVPSLLTLQTLFELLVEREKQILTNKHLSTSSVMSNRMIIMFVDKFISIHSILNRFHGVISKR